MLRMFASAAVCISWLAIAPAFSAAEDANVATEHSDLKLPTGVAIRPNGLMSDYEIWIAEAGAGRVIRLRGSKPESKEVAITGFPTQRGDNDAIPTAGPHGLLFLDNTRLIVAGGGSHPFVHLYKLSEEQSPLTADDYEQSAQPSAKGNSLKAIAIAFHAIARTSPNENVQDQLLLTAHGHDRNTGGLWKLPLRADTLSKLEQLEVEPPNRESNVPAAVAVSPQGYVVVAQSVSDGESAPSSLTFVNPIDSSVVMQVPTELRHIVALAYSPTTGNLYAANFATRVSPEGGIFRIDDATQPGKPASEAVKIADIHRPTALAFAPDGTLYVTSFGIPKQREPAGAVISISGDL